MILWRLSFLGNLKPSNNKFVLRTTPTWNPRSFFLINFPILCAIPTVASNNLVLVRDFWPTGAPLLHRSLTRPLEVHVGPRNTSVWHVGVGRPAGYLMTKRGQFEIRSGKGVGQLQLETLFLSFECFFPHYLPYQPLPQITSSWPMILDQLVRHFFNVI